MTGVLVSGYDVDTKHIADVLEDLAGDIRDEDVYVNSVADGIDADSERFVTYDFEMSIVMTQESEIVDHVDGRLTRFEDDK